MKIERITIKCPYCPCMFGTEVDYQAHLREFSTNRVEHLRKFVEVHELSSDRRKKWALKYLNRDNI